MRKYGVEKDVVGIHGEMKTSFISLRLNPYPVLGG